MPNLSKYPDFKNWSYLIPCVSLIERKLYALFNVFDTFVLMLLCVFLHLSVGKRVGWFKSLYIVLCTHLKLSVIFFFKVIFRKFEGCKYHSNSNNKSRHWSHVIHSLRWWMYVVAEERCEPMQFLHISVLCEGMNMHRHTCVVGVAFIWQYPNSVGQLLLKLSCFIHSVCLVCVLICITMIALWLVRLVG